MSHHVLVVDDDPNIREMIEAVLTDEGFTVGTASNGREALERIGESRPKLVLLDLQMPVMTGWDVIRQLHESRVEVPIVFMTAGFRARREAEQHGADGYLAKPFELNDLLDVVERFASSHQG